MPLSPNHEKEAVAMIRLWANEADHTHLPGTSQSVGMSIIEGIRIFNIGGDLGSAGDLSRGFERWLPAMQGRRLPHKPRMLGVVGGKGKKLHLSSLGPRGRGRGRGIALYPPGIKVLRAGGFGGRRVRQGRERMRQRRRTG